MASLINAVASIGLASLTAHTARVRGATNENEACAQFAPAVQADLQEVAQALNDGQISSQDAINFLMQVDYYLYSELKSNVGAAGTAWESGPGGCLDGTTNNSQVLEGGKFVSPGPYGSCGKTCTVSCCIYYSYWEPALDCFVKKLMAGQSNFTVSVQAIPSNKYGFPGAPSFTAVVNIPPQNSVTNIPSTVNNAINNLLGNTQPATQAENSQISSTSTEINKNLLLIGGVAFLLIGAFAIGRK